MSMCFAIRERKTGSIGRDARAPLGGKMRFDTLGSAGMIPLRQVVARHRCQPSLRDEQSRPSHPLFFGS